MSEQENKSSFKPGLVFWVGVICLMGLFAWAAMPNFVNPKKGPAWDANHCINNLRIIDAAANQFAFEHNKTNGETINYPNDLMQYFKDGKIPTCPAGGIYSITKVGEAPTCSVGSTVNPAHVLQ
jgi:hypothetical protein